MHSHIYFVIFFFHAQYFFTNCLPDDDGFITINSTTSIETDSLNSTEPNSDPVCLSNRCVRKCCKANEIYVWKNKHCLPDHADQLQNADWSTHFSKFEIIYNSRCPQTTIVLNNSRADDEYEIFDNGSIYAFEILISSSQYCMDYLQEDDTIRPVLCYEEIFGPNEGVEDKYVFMLYSTGLGISNLFLIITLGLYLATPRLCEKVHDKCFLCHVVTLIIGFSSLIGIQNIAIENSACAFLSYMSQFWLLASFFWLNIMCIDMWRSVGNMQISKESNMKKLILYCLYAWGCPCLILIFSLLADNFLPSDHPLRTGFGEETCWFRHNKGNDSWLDPRYVHFYLFISLTLLINIYTFVDTALMIKYQNKLWKQDNNADSKRHKPQNPRVFLYLKLFIVMGLYWMMEVISYHSDGKNVFWVTVDCINTLQGVFIFIIFICNKRALTILKKRFFARKVFLKQYNRTFSDRQRSTCSKTSKASITEDITVTSNSLVRTNGGHELDTLSNKSLVY